MSAKKCPRNTPASLTSSATRVTLRLTLFARTFAPAKPIRGAEVDDVARGVITRAGHGEQFTHRTGHSIGEEVHGNGVNIDNFETRDSRRITPGVCFSIEPGIYQPGKFGVRPRSMSMFERKTSTSPANRSRPRFVPILKLK